MQDAYKQIKLNPKSRHLTVFSTHKGLYRDTRLRAGMNAAAENFQWIIADQIKDLKGVVNVSDDIIVHGSNSDEHQVNLHKLLGRLESIGLTANLAKCEFNMNSIDFFGVNFSSKGISPSASRVKSFQEAKSPTSASEVRSLLAIANYSARFIKDFAKVVAPLRELTKINSQFEWLQEHENILIKLKAALTTNSLAYFNPEWDTEIIADASPVGLGSVLIQSNPSNPELKQVIAFASRSLSVLEKKYSQVEKEALALVFSVEKFHQYVYGKRFKLYSDAKAIVFIYGNMTHKSPARIERWGLRLLPYDFELIHTPGDGNPADYLSRHPVDPAEMESNDADLHVNFIVDNSVPRAIKRSQIAKATREDGDMQTLVRAINTSNQKVIAKSNTLKEFNNVFNQLSVSDDGIILRNHQIVVPKELRQKLVDIVHEGHLGIVKSKMLMRLKVWFPRLNEMVEARIGGCLACQACTPANKKNMVPMQSEPVPNMVWHTVAGDFFGPLPSGHYLLVLICKTSGYPVVEVVSSTSSKTILPILDRVFSEFGIPKIFCSDNGPPFQSHDFKNFLEYLGIEHKRATPYWPRGNAKCERFMKNIGKTLKIAQLEGKPWKQVLYQFLRSYRAAPHVSTETSPNKLMFGRNTSSRLPSIEVDSSSNNNNILKTSIEKSNRVADKNRAYMNKRLGTKPNVMKPGDKVLVKQQKINKLSAQYNPESLTVIAREGSWVLSKDKNGKEIARNISFFKSLTPDKNNETVSPNTTTISCENSLGTSESNEELSLFDEELTADETIEFEDPKTKEYLEETVNENKKEVYAQAPSSAINESLNTPIFQSKHSAKKASIDKKRSHRATKTKVNYREARQYNKKPVSL